MRKVLIISHNYPPYQNAGAVRISKFSRYLPEYGWSPIVLTGHSDFPATLPLEIAPEAVYRTQQFDANWPLTSLPHGRAVVQMSRVSQCPGIQRQLLHLARLGHRHFLKFPDGQIGWYPFALPVGRRIVSQEQPDVIFSSALPPTCHLLAYRLAGETGLPWMAEFQDLWTDNHNFRRIEPLRSLERVLERHIVRAADLLVTVSDSKADVLRTRFSQPVVVIPNGYDPSDYPNGVPLTRKFTLTYTGTFYPGKQNPTPLFVAIAELRQQNLITPATFELRLFGRGLESLRTSVTEMGIEPLVSVAGVVPREQALRLQLESTGLVLLLWTGSGGEDVYTSKLFEYLGAGRPILALGPGHTSVARFVEAEGGVVAQTHQQVEAILRQWLEEFQTRGEVAVRLNGARPRRFEHQTLTGQLAAVLNKVYEAKYHA